MKLNFLFAILVIFVSKCMTFPYNRGENDISGSTVGFNRQKDWSLIKHAGGTIGTQKTERSEATEETDSSVGSSDREYSSQVIEKDESALKSGYQKISVNESNAKKGSSVSDGLDSNGTDDSRVFQGSAHIQSADDLKA